MSKEEIEALIKASLEAAGFLSKAEFSATAAMITRMNKSLETMATGSLSPAKLVELGLLEQAADGSFKAKIAATPVTKKEDKEPEWQVQLRQMQTQMEAKDKALLAANEQREASELKSAVIAAFDKAGAVNGSRDYVHVLPLVKRAADGTFQTVTKDQFGVETNVPLDQAFGTFLKANPELAKAAGHAGSGTPAAATIAGSSPKDVNALAAMPMDQYFAERKAGKL